MVAAPPWGFDDLPPTGRWLLAHGLPTLRRGPTAPMSEVAWTSLRAATTQHSLEGLLVAAVASGALPVNDEQRAQAADSELELTRQRMAYEARILPILAAFDDAGIDVRVLKGVAVGALDYPDAQMRSTADLDVLVRGSEIRRAVQVLVDLGGTWTNPEPAPRYLETVGKGATVLVNNIEVDLHRLLGWGPLGIRLDPDLLWTRSATLELGGRPSAALAREERFLHACQHLVLLGAIRAREVRDVAEIACHPNFDADLAAELAGLWGTQLVVAHAVLLAARELGLPDGEMPLANWARALRPPLTDRMWARADRPTSPVVGVDQVAMLWEVHDWSARAKLVRANLRPLAGSDPGLLGRAPRAMARWRADLAARAARRKRRASVEAGPAGSMKSPIAEGTDL